MGASGGGFDANFPDCVGQACPYSTSAHKGGASPPIAIDPRQRFSPGQRPFFKVEKTSSDRWQASWAYGGGWNPISSGSFASTNFAWVASGHETLSTGSGTAGAEIHDPGIRHMNNMASLTSFGNKWVWGNFCNSEVVPWCYTHIVTTLSGCSNCGVTQPHGQTFGSHISSCSGIGGCDTLWTTKTN